MNIQVPSHSYLTKKYLSLERFIGYFYQIDTVKNTKAKSILLIGVGDGIVPGILKKSPEYTVTTMDFDSELSPDVVGDIRSLPFKDKSFDLICAFEVLEHIPYEDMIKVLEEFSRISKEDVILSVPHRRTGFEIVLKFPFIRSIFKKDFLRMFLGIPIRFSGFSSSGQHYWEIDGHTTPLKAFRSELSKKFEIISEKTPVFDSYRRFFYLKILKNIHPTYFSKNIGNLKQ
jgi:ubiquinone/menaquinone biosynthesis C-methylase UbiE